MKIKLEIEKGSVRINDQQDFKEFEITKNILSRQTEEFSVKINTEDFDRIKVEIGCGCTKAEVVGNIINFKYTPNVLGSGRKKVTILAYKGGETVKQVTYIKANVI